MPLKQFRLYLDECGTEDYACVESQGGRFLSLVGLVMDQSLAQTATDRLNDLKRRHFSSHPDDPPVVMHRTDIQRRRGAFSVLNAIEADESFREDWIQFIEQTEFTIICVVIDKKAMQKKENWKIRHPYHYAMSLIVEKYTQLLNYHDAHGDIMPEGRGRQKDGALEAVFREVRETGTHWVGSGVIKNRIPSQNLKFRTKKDNVTGLQVCDSLAKVAQDHVLALKRISDHFGPYAGLLRNILVRDKFDRSERGQMWGYGIKFLPR